MLVLSQQELFLLRSSLIEPTQVAAALTELMEIYLDRICWHGVSWHSMEGSCVFLIHVIIAFIALFLHQMNPNELKTCQSWDWEEFECYLFCCIYDFFVRRNAIQEVKAGEIYNVRSSKLLAVMAGHVLCFALTCWIALHQAESFQGHWLEQKDATWKIIVVVTVTAPADLHVFPAAAISSKFAIYKSDPSSESSPLQGLFASFKDLKCQSIAPTMFNEQVQCIVVALALCNRRKCCVFTHFGKNMTYVLEVIWWFCVGWNVGGACRLVRCAPQVLTATVVTLAGGWASRKLPCVRQYLRSGPGFHVLTCPHQDQASKNFPRSICSTICNSPSQTEPTSDKSEYLALQ